jgi:hypothetical protein
MQAISIALTLHTGFHSPSMPARFIRLAMLASLPAIIPLLW